MNFAHLCYLKIVIQVRAISEKELMWDHSQNVKQVVPNPIPI